MKAVTDILEEVLFKFREGSSKVGSTISSERFKFLAMDVANSRIITMHNTQ